MQKATPKVFSFTQKGTCAFKILDNVVSDIGDIEIPVYYSNNSEEKVSSINGVTYNLENGKIVKSKLDKSNIITEEKNDRWKTVKVPMPNVKAGSIIELSYIITSEFFFNLHNWHFQHKIPVLQSEYHVSIPEYYYFNQTTKGYFPIEIKTDSRQNELTLTYVQKAEGTAVQERSYTNTIRYMDKMHSYHAKNLPAFIDDDYVKCADNYLSKIEFELSYTKFPEQPVKYYTTTWEDVCTEYLEHEKFGEQLKSARYLDDFVLSIKQSGLQGPELMIAAFDSVKGHMAWTNQKGPG
ncbi:MAG: DUF3857 domain-containing protein [Bacteroidales bacterium]|nr:DUF3857 domain-containing protein [Bacteroidales bacterium]